MMMRDWREFIAMVLFGAIIGGTLCVLAITISSCEVEHSKLVTQRQVECFKSHSPIECAMIEKAR